MQWMMRNAWLLASHCQSPDEAHHSPSNIKTERCRVDATKDEHRFLVIQLLAAEPNKPIIIIFITQSLNSLRSGNEDLGASAG